MSFGLVPSKWSFQALPGYFVYTNPSIDNATLPAIPLDFGLEQGMTWKQLRADLKALNATRKSPDAQYKLIYLARHGEGFHNVAEAKYGTEAWDAHWSLLNGDGEATWGPDPPLTDIGEGQARDAARIWSALLTARSDDETPPLPTRFYSSPMIRAARTLQLTFDGIVWPQEESESDKQHCIAQSSQRPHILECIREDFRDRHTCDQRNTRSNVAERWEPLGWAVEESMDEEDTLFTSTLKETNESMSQRLSDALAKIWHLSEGQDVISITAHSGAMQALFRAVQHDDFKPKTGGMVPLFLKATALQQAHTS